MKLLLVLMAAAAVGRNTATIKSVAVAGPVVGSQSTFGRVDLTAPAAQRVVIALMFNNPRLASAPVNVVVGMGETAQTFVVKTEPVAAPTTVTLTASTTGSPDASANFTVIPPALTILDCEPKSVPGGSQATCKAWMDGLVAAGATPQLALSTSNNQVAWPMQATVTVPAGNRWVTFNVFARDLPQSATAMISATYAGVTKNSSLTVTPAAIKRFGCLVAASSAETASLSSQCSVVGGNYYYYSSLAEQRNVGFAVRITAPAPPSGYKIPLTFNLGAPPGPNGEEPPPSLFGGIPKTLEVPAGKDFAFYPFHTEPSAATYVVKVSAKDPITQTSYETELTVTPPGIRQVRFQYPTLSAVPLGGKEVDVIAEFMSTPPNHGIAYDVIYAGTTDIKGPARVRIDPRDAYRTDSFKVKVFPCALNPPCHVSVTLAGHTGNATVNP